MCMCSYVDSMVEWLMSKAKGLIYCDSTFIVIEIDLKIGERERVKSGGLIPKR